MIKHIVGHSTHMYSVLKYDELNMQTTLIKTESSGTWLN